MTRGEGRFVCVCKESWMAEEKKKRECQGIYTRVRRTTGENEQRDLVGDARTRRGSKGYERMSTVECDRVNEREREANRPKRLFRLCFAQNCSQL